MKRRHGLDHESRVQAELDTLCSKKGELKQQHRRILTEERGHKRQQLEEHRMVVIFMCLEHGSQCAAEACLHQRRGLQSGGCAEILQTAKLEYDGMDDDSKTALLEDVGPRPCAKLRKAKRFLQEFKLHRWVEQQNLTKGIAPVTKLVGEEWAKTSQGTSSVPQAHNRSMKQWLRRWRARWGVQLGRIVAREHLSDSESRLKAFLYWHPKGSAVKCWTFRTPRDKKWIKNRCRIVDPVLGPRT